jgi:hypothetical protein
MLMHHWSVGLARVYALQALEEEIRRQHGIPRPEPRRLLRKSLAAGLKGTGRLLSGLGERLAPRSSPEARPYGCG